jgi:hypothetical protein
MTGFGAGVFIEISVGYIWHSFKSAHSNATSQMRRSLDPGHADRLSPLAPIRAVTGSFWPRFNPTRS